MLPITEADPDTGVRVLDVDPGEEAIAEQRSRQEAAEAERLSLMARAAEPGALRDGRRVEVFANVGSAAEAARAVEQGAEGVGLLRVRGDRLEATSLRHAWAQIDQGLRAGLCYAAWCHRVPWPVFLHGGPGVEALVEINQAVIRGLASDGARP